MRSATLAGTPYRPGDHVEIETAVGWVDLAVVEVQRQDGRFGCHWQLLLGSGAALLMRNVDDNGLNYTIGRKVRPSGRIGE